MLGIDPRTARITWTVLFILLMAELAWLARKTLLIFVLALLLAYLLHPLVNLVRRTLPFRLPATFAPVIVYLGGLGVVVMAMLGFLHAPGHGLPRPRHFAFRWP